MEFARIDDETGKVIEISPNLPAGSTPVDWYGEQGWHWEPAAEGMTTDWTWADGAFVPPPPPPEPDLGEVKTALKTAVDAAAEVERRRYITPGAGQAMTYQQKASEAVMLEDDPAPEPAAYPLLSAEVGITAPTLAEVGTVVRQAHGQWILLGAAIEAARLGAKKAIDEAETMEAAQAAAVVDWPG